MQTLSHNNHVIFFKDLPVNEAIGFLLSELGSVYICSV